MKAIKEVKFYKFEADIELEDGSRLSFEWDGKYDVIEEDIIEWMTENGIEPKSVDLWVGSFVKNYQIE